MQQQRQVAAHLVERLAGDGDPGGDLGVVGDAERPEVVGGHALGPLTADHLEAEVGEPLGQQALRGADDEDRLLQPALAADESDLLAAVLGVVAGVGLMGDEVSERGGQHREVGIDDRPAVEVAEVVVEP